jgi:hypothetical protein
MRGELKRSAVVAALRKLREELEEGTGRGIDDLVMLVALLLSDVCAALGLAPGEQEIVLGPNGAAFVEAFLSTQAAPADPAKTPQPAVILPIVGPAELA